VIVASWLAWCDNRGLHPQDVKREDFLVYLGECRQRGLKVATLQKRFAGLISFYEFLGSAAVVREIQKKYIRPYKPDGELRQIISVPEAAAMVAATLGTRDRAILLLLLKTGIRRTELASLDVEDVNLPDMSLRLKPTSKRSNRLLFFDAETQDALRRWLAVRQGDGPALFCSSRRRRISGDTVRYAMVNAAERVGLHSSGAPLEERFGAHCCRHWFTTHLRRAGMRREFIQELRGDSRREAIDIYDHIDLRELKEAYLACIPQLGI